MMMVMRLASLLSVAAFALAAADSTKPQCPERMEWLPVLPQCQATCRDRRTARHYLENFAECHMDDGGGSCVCEQDYVRNDFYGCIFAEDCPSPTKPPLIHLGTKDENGGKGGGNNEYDEEYDPASGKEEANSRTHVMRLPSGTPRSTHSPPVVVEGSGEDATTTNACPEGSERQTLAKRCEPSCDDQRSAAARRFDDYSCATTVEECICRAGTLRDCDGRCISPALCPIPGILNCQSNEQEALLTVDCEPTCWDRRRVDELLAASSLCRADKPRCVCAEGTVRDTSGRCVPPGECPYNYDTICPLNEVYFPLREECEATCKDCRANIQFYALDGCRFYGFNCVCANGFVRIDGRCVEAFHCGRQQNNCPPAETPTLGHYGHRPRCVQLPGAATLVDDKLQRFCACADAEQICDADGNCMHIWECSRKRCPENEKLARISKNCEPTCADPRRPHIRLAGDEAAASAAAAHEPHDEGRQCSTDEWTCVCVSARRYARRSANYPLERCVPLRRCQQEVPNKPCPERQELQRPARHDDLRGRLR